MPGPYRQGTSSGTVFVPGSSAAGDQPWVNLQIVGPEYFATLGTTLVAGREFSRRDDPDSNSVAVVNEAFVRKFFAGRNPLDGVVGQQSDGPWAHIIGIVRDIAHGGVREKPEPTLYLPVTKKNVSWGTALVRSRMPRDAVIQAVRREVERLGPQVSSSEPRSIGQDIDDSIFQDRMLASLSGCFGGLTLLLAAIGLYGVVSYGTAQRSGEIGIRIALGAQRGRVLWMVLRSGLLLVAGGLAVGLPVSIAAARYVSAVLFGVTAGDPLAFVSTAAVLLGIGLAAAFWPARRSASMDPMRALRHE
jgi:predicted permease